MTYELYTLQLFVADNPVQEDTAILPLRDVKKRHNYSFSQNLNWKLYFFQSPKSGGGKPSIDKQHTQI